MSREADNRAASQYAACRRRREIILTEVYSRGSAEKSEVTAVVHDDWNAERSCILHAAAKVVEELSY
jgi:hypothetical protein